MSLLMTVTLLLSACATTVSKTEIEVYCPFIKEYPAEFTTQLINELSTLPQDRTAITEVVSDYIDLREVIRACEVERKKIK
jgi:hypothetical protein